MQLESTASEHWLPAPGFEDAYEISNLGRLRRIKPGHHTRPGLVLRVRQVGHPRAGYPGVHLRHNGERQSKTIFLHVLVAKAFLGPKPTPTHQVNHIDGNKWNSSATNLEWVTPSENMQHGQQMGLFDRAHRRGVASNLARLTDAEVLAIRASDPLISHSALARAYSVHRMTITRIRHHQTWQHL